MKKDREKFLCAIYILIRNDKNEVLLQRRQGTKLWPGFLALPAGHVDEGENVYEAFVREAKEELGIEVSKNDIINTFVINRKNKSLSSYFDVYFEIKSYVGEIIINEKDKCEELVWARIVDLPSDMITFEKEAIANNNKGIKFSVILADNEEKLVKMKSVNS